MLLCENKGTVKKTSPRSLAAEQARARPSSVPCLLRARRCSGAADCGVKTLMAPPASGRTEPGSAPVRWEAVLVFYPCRDGQRAVRPRPIWNGGSESRNAESQRSRNPGIPTFPRFRNTGVLSQFLAFQRDRASRPTSPLAGRKIAGMRERPRFRIVGMAAVPAFPRFGLSGLRQARRLRRSGGGPSQRGESRSYRQGRGGAEKRKVRRAFSTAIPRSVQTWRRSNRHDGSTA